MPHKPDSTPCFTPDELDLLGRTADALSAYMGKAVLAEVMDAEETGFEWVLFGAPLDAKDEAEDLVTVQIGGAGARLLGNKGGLDIGSDEVFDCEYLWAIQLSTLEGVRFIKVDQQGDEIAWTDDLREILPFHLSDEPVPNDGDGDEPEDDDEDDPNGDEGDAEDYPPGPSRRLH
ncbi:hypothetical protein [Paralcaligenes ureilyticus]|uniref:Uncharacterized protein n=1 Tax=Paralcaligenes ureilyticus TaxID=627131 RepID=A0A4R3LXA8_9BURK|nr:hypothetical protein [Paralcaligenes ureilyticus]TCT05270.1 hypothetical protein EDC26_11010 [Paralcaligenes ureilyticus]